MAKIQTWRRISCAASVMGPRPDRVVVANRMTAMEMMLRDDSDTPAWHHVKQWGCRLSLPSMGTYQAGKTRRAHSTIKSES
jgi:hypothetical protein